MPAAAPDLAHVVDLHWLVRWEVPGGSEHAQSVLPLPCVNVASGDGGPLVYGPVGRRFDRILSGTGWAVGTRIRAGWFPGVAGGRAAHTLTDGAQGLGVVFAPDGDALAKALSRADPDAHVTATEAFLRAHLPKPDDDAALAAAIVDHMLSEPTTAPVDAVARHFAFSPRSLQRLFRHYVGISPKAVLRRSRPHEAVERVDAGAGDGAALAADLGSSDHAHFVNDFRSVVGRPPGRYRV